jgi:hypothetical protein
MLVGVIVGVTVGVGVGVGDIPSIVASILFVKHKFKDGVTVGVGVGVGVEVGDGDGIASHSNTAIKSNTSQLIVGVGVGVKHIPDEKYSSHKSGHSLTQGDFPDNKQDPSNADDKHH